ncbi:MAG: CDP-glycerol glycerophosphotransferase family protein [Bacilli bacterium]|nr:CDP-glycerol glycerophosphotransferase family protein [Bacilli bacterium]
MVQYKGNLDRLEISDNMVSIIKIYIVFLNAIYILFKFNKSKKKVFFLSRQGNSASIDYKLIIKELEKKYPTYEIVVMTKKIEKKPLTFFIKNNAILFKQMYHLSTSEICIIDGYNLSVSVLKHKKELKIIQIWHALGGVKKFGSQIKEESKKMKINKALKQHENYDYIITSSKKTKNIYQEAFNYESNKIIEIGMPRIDYILQSEKENKQNIYKKYPEFKNKKIVLYAPTFRENNNYKIKELINGFDEDYTIILKLHPAIKIDLSSLNNNIYTCKEFTSLEILSVADYIITDYSAFSIEASLLNKKLYFYVYDYEEYLKKPGLNIDLYKYFNGYIYKQPKKIIEKIKQEEYDLNLVKKYRKDYVSNINEDVTEKLVEFIMEEK